MRVKRNKIRHVIGFDPDSYAQIHEERRVDNPLTTWSQFLHELDTGNPDAGVLRASVNLLTLMGGFARFHGTEAQQRAAARFLALHEASQVGGARAVDPSVEPVDGGWLNPEGNLINGSDARRQWVDLTNYLGRMDTKRFTFVVVAGRGPTSYAKHWYGVRQPNARQISRGMVEVRRIADRAAVFLKLQSTGIAAAPS